MRKYLYDSDEVLIEYNENDQVLATYTHSTLRTDDTLSVDITSEGISASLAKQAGSYFYLKDALGSITDITNSEGELVQHISYSSFGEIKKIVDKNESNITQDPLIASYLTYTNREYYKETGLYHYRARAYDASIGRFLQEDPHPGKILSPLSFTSKYIYTQNNPTLFTDPTGLLINFKKIEKGIKNFYDKNKKGINATLVATATIVTVVAVGALIATTVGTTVVAFGGAGSAKGLAAGLGFGALAGVAAANINSYITRGERATGSENLFGAFAGAIGGLISASVGGFGATAVNRVNDANRATITSATAPQGGGSFCSWCGQ